ncbi:proton myo-inositol cotransporter-like protein [Leptotrombidium deliense]|uniref:Proton myo-inositol cotransporter-like protein n=1 Tax=Leptotrombidium deliense TaxID=299467 RepID=A0A443SNL0_9ACAR|nr:proton myo-inositol cotransporter-like protein [Leptotrombidium deliense]
MVEGPSYTSDDEEGRSLMLDTARSRVKATKFVYIATLLTAIGGFLFGYDTGIVSGAMVFIKDEFQLNNLWQELIVSVTVLSAGIFSAFAGYSTDAWGRKLVIIMSSIIFAIGALLLGFAWSKEILLIGRLIVGAASGISSMVVPIYIAELAPASNRGTLVIINNAFVTGGQFIAALIAGGFTIPALIQLIGFLFLPESPRWLVRRGKYEDSLKSLRKIRGINANVEQEFESIREACVQQEREMAEKGGTSVFEQILSNSNLRKAMLVGCMLQIIQQLAGINCVMYYAATIVQMSGVQSKSKAVWIAAIGAGVNFACTFIGLFLVEKVGRRVLVLVSLAGVILSVSTMAVGFQISAYNSPVIAFHDNSTSQSICRMNNDCQSCSRLSSCGFCYVDSGQINGTCLVVSSDNRMSTGGLCKSGTDVKKHIIWAYEWCPTSYAWITFLGLSAYLFFFAFGMGPMPWVINAEIYPQWARSVCTSTSTTFNWFFNFLTSISFLTLSQSITKYGTFWLYAAFSIFGWIFFYLLLPETKGKTLEEVERLFEKKIDSTTLVGGVQNVQRKKV